ncbi:CrcB family protein [Microbacterium sp. 10M-3C3]|uniref:fluoride efflux transporter FluC n=1 Tax=Microbacterium sp. 10M-3C3 TaxID=2483401 RepID=UPI000F631871|nr:CrcB family protein [Microbacterium sp. 10M-3C3]
MFSWAHLGLVILGGALGTAARAGLQLAVGDALGGWFVPVVNIVGAFALGVVTGLLARRMHAPRGRVIRHFVGTGVLGGFTTYSALAVEAAHSPVLLAVGIAGAALGTAAGAIGLAVTAPRRAGA